MSPLRLLVVDDHRLVREGLAALLSTIESVGVVSQAANGREAIEWLRCHGVDIVFLDISMPELNGIDVAQRIVAEFSGTKVVMLSINTIEEYVVKAMRVGASGFLSKNSDRTELEQAIQAVAAGGSYLTPSVAQTVAEYIRRVGDDGEAKERLTPRQREVLQLLAEGVGMKEIARRLSLSVKTIETHRAQIMKELNIFDVAGLVRYAIRTGITSADG